jgi:hypothetical protein
VTQADFSTTPRRCVGKGRKAAGMRAINVLIGAGYAAGFFVGVYLLSVYTDNRFFAAEIAADELGAIVVNIVRAVLWVIASGIVWSAAALLHSKNPAASGRVCWYGGLGLFLIVCAVAVWWDSTEGFPTDPSVLTEAMWAWGLCAAVAILLIGASRVIRLFVRSRTPQEAGPSDPEAWPPAPTDGGA